jgi:hypothetical protein
MGFPIGVIQATFSLYYLCCWIPRASSHDQLSSGSSRLNLQGWQTTEGLYDPTSLPRSQLVFGREGFISMGRYSKMIRGNHDISEVLYEKFNKCVVCGGHLGSQRVPIGSLATCLRYCSYCSLTIFSKV